MAFCGNCGTQVNDGVAFCPKCGQAINATPNAQQQTVSAQPGTQAYQQPQQQPMKPDSHMILAILSTIFCCLFTGVYAIILANKVDKLYYAGQYNEAEKAANGAKTWSIVGAVLAFVGWLIYILFGGLTLLGLAAAAS